MNRENVYTTEIHQKDEKICYFPGVLAGWAQDSKWLPAGLLHQNHPPASIERSSLSGTMSSLSGTTVTQTQCLGASLVVKGPV